MDSRKVLILFTSGAIICLTVALFGTATMSLYAFPILGFALSVMWSIVFSLALNSLESNHGAFSGILCTGIVGGAVMSLIIGKIGDLIGLRFAMTLLYVTPWIHPKHGILGKTINYKCDNKSQESKRKSIIT